MRLLVVAFLLVGLFAPIATATHDPNDFWVKEQNIVPYDIHASSATNVWGLQLGGTAFRRTVSAGIPVWVGHDTGLVDTNAAGAIFALDDTHVYACSGTGTQPDDAWVSVYNGISFSKLGSFPGDIIGSCSAIWAFSATNVWIGGVGAAGGTNDGFVANWNGASWTVNDAIDSAVRDFWAFSSTDLWAISNNGEIWHYTGTWAMTADTSIISSPGIWGTSSTNLYAFGNTLSTGAAVLLRSTNTGVTWTPITPEGVNLILDVNGVGATDFWLSLELVGGVSSLKHSATATTFTEEDSGTTSLIKPIWFTTATEGYFATLQNSVSQNTGVFKLQSLPNVALPVLTGLMLQRNDFNVEASQAQCNGDETALRVETDRTIGGGGISVWVINSDTNVVVQNWMNAQAHADWFNLQNHLLHTSKIYPPGDYVLVGTVDVLGALEDDQFSSVPFNVPLGTCIDSVFDDTQLRTFIVERTNQTNSYVNTTSEAILENLTSVHVHIDSHFNMTDSLIVSQFFQTNGYINTSRIQILDAINDLDLNIDCGNETENCTFEAQTMIDLPGLTDQQVGAFLLFLVMLIISFFQRWLFVAIASVIGILEVFILGGVFGFEFTGLLLVIGIMLQIFVDHRDAMLEKKRETEGGEIGD